MVSHSWPPGCRGEHRSAHRSVAACQDGGSGGLCRVPQYSPPTQPQSRKGVPQSLHSYDKERGVGAGGVRTTQTSLKQSIRKSPSLGDGKLEVSDGISVLMN